MSDKNKENIAELVSILQEVNCPSVIRSDDWWIEELMFKSGKPRTDLIVWILLKGGALNGSSYASFQDLDSTNASTNSSSYNKLVESDEAIFEVLCDIGIFTDKDLPFLKGNLPKSEQLKYWNVLIKALQDPQYVSTKNAFGYSSMSDAVSRDNFLDVFNMKASLIPPDLKSEILQLYKKIKNIEQPKSCAALEKNGMHDKLFAQNLSEKAKRWDPHAEKFIEISNSDLKMCIPKRETSCCLIEIGKEIDSISSKFTTWKNDVDSLLELQQNTISENNGTRAENLLKRSIKEKSFKPFQNLCGTE